MATNAWLRLPSRRAGRLRLRRQLERAGRPESTRQQAELGTVSLSHLGVIYFTLRDVGWDSVFLEAGTGARLHFSPGFCQ